MHQYATSTIRTTGPGGEPIELRVATGYPWSGSVRSRSWRARREEWTLGLRIPAWTRAATLDGEPVAAGSTRS